jgi:signal transduction histidine kinase
MLNKAYAPQMAEEDKDKLQRIIRASERMKLLIGNLLSFSRASNDSGDPEPTNLNTLLQSIISDLEVLITQKDASIELRELPVLQVNPVLMRQVFQNLIINALKFCKDGCCPEIVVYAEKIYDTKANGTVAPYYNIHVRDNGIGFDMAYKDHVFVPFKRLHTQDQFEGTGIGLAICKKIVEKHHGTISVQSVEDQGTTFTITLPDAVPVLAGVA